MLTCITIKDTDTPVKSKSPRTKFGAKALATMIPIFLGGNHYPTADEYAHIAATTGVNDPAAVKGWFANQYVCFSHFHVLIRGVPNHRVLDQATDASQ